MKVNFRALGYCVYLRSFKSSDLTRESVEWRPSSPCICIQDMEQLISWSSLGTSSKLLPIYLFIYLCFQLSFPLKLRFWMWNKMGRLKSCLDIALGYNSNMDIKPRIFNVFVIVVVFKQVSLLNKFKFCDWFQ